MVCARPSPFPLSCGERGPPLTSPLVAFSFPFVKPMNRPPTTALRTSLEDLGFRLVTRVPRRLITIAAGRAARVPVARPLRRALYGAFARAVGADPSEAELPLDQYATFNAFFTRRLRHDARPWNAPPHGLGAPCDGRLDAHGTIAAGELIQAKGIAYGIDELLATDGAAPDFEGGTFVTIYLSPADYHRVHAPCELTVDTITHAGGELWPVNQLSVPRVSGLFAVNERVIARGSLADGRPFALVMVGATVVGQISVAHASVRISSAHLQGAVDVPLSPAWSLEQGDEFGTFHLGSTIVLLIGPGSRRLTIHDALRQGDPVRLGDALLV